MQSINEKLINNKLSAMQLAILLNNNRFAVRYVIETPAGEMIYIMDDLLAKYFNHREKLNDYMNTLSNIKAQLSKQEEDLREEKKTKKSEEQNIKIKKDQIESSKNNIEVLEKHIQNEEKVIGNFEKMFQQFSIDYSRLINQPDNYIIYESENELIA